MREKESQALGRKPRGEFVGGKSRIEREHSEERETLLQGREKKLLFKVSRSLLNIVKEMDELKCLINNIRPLMY